MNKKFISAVMAGAMAVSALGVSAFAADTEKVEAAGEKTLKATAAFAPVAIDVTLPTSITAAINPYKIDYDFSGDKAGTSGVVSPIYEIVNNTTDYGVKVGAKVAAAPSKTVTVATADRKTGAAPTFKNDNTEDKTIFAYLNTTVEDDKSFANDTYTATDDTQLLFTEDMPDNSVVLMQIAKGGKSGYFQIQGDCVEEPAEKWTKDDKVELSIVFDINPFNDSAEATPPAVKISTDDSTLNGVSVSGKKITVTASLSDGGGDTADFTLADEDGNAIKKSGSDVTIAIGTDADGILTLANNGKVTIATSGTPGKHTATIVLTDTANSKTETYTVEMTEVA